MAAVRFKIENVKLLSLWHIILTVALFASASNSAWAARKPMNQYISFSTYYSNYNNLSLGSEGGKNLPSSLEVELGLRMHSIFNFLITGAQWSDPDSNDDNMFQNKISAVGAGLGVDLPGFFFVGAKAINRKRTKNYPINTSLFFQTLLVTSKPVAGGADSRTVSTRYGFGIDFFLFNPVAYFTIRGGAFNYLSDLHAFYSAGIGVTF